MQKEEFKTLANSYGAHLHRWPAELREEAKHLFAENSDVLAGAAKLDHELDSFKVIGADPSLLQRIMADIERQERETGLPRPEDSFIFRHVWAEATALAFCALFGLFLGAANFTADSGPEEAMDIDHVIFGSTTFNEVLP